MNPTKLRKAFGEKVRALRKHKKISQEELADKAGLHHTYVGVIERAEQAATLDTVEKLAQALNVEVKDLFRFLPEEHADKLKEENIAALSGKDPKILQKILDIIKVMTR
jgi:transcriptional regulator with XRE-family HTH domain